MNPRGSKGDRSGFNENLFYSFDIGVVFRPDLLQETDGRMRSGTGRIRFDADVGKVVFGAECIEDFFLIRFFGHHLENSQLPLDDFFGAGKAFFRKKCRHQPVHGGLSRIERFTHGSKHLADTGGLGAADAESIDDRIAIQVKEL